MLTLHLRIGLNSGAALSHSVEKHWASRSDALDKSTGRLPLQERGKLVGPLRELHQLPFRLNKSVGDSVAGTPGS
jgi:hypothetical protein